MSMSMASRAWLPLLLSCLRRSAYVPSSTEEPHKIDKRRQIGLRRDPGHGAPEAVVDSRYGNMYAEDEALAYETEKRKWITEQKRLIAEAMRRSGGPDPRWNDPDRGVPVAAADSRTPSEQEPLSAYEIKKRRWIAEKKRSIAAEARRQSRSREAARGWNCPGSRKRNSPKVHPLVTEEKISAPAKPPVRVAFADRFGPGSDAAFLKGIIAAAGKSGGGGENASRLRGDPDCWAEMEEAYSRRQRYLRHYCPFQREEDDAPEKTMKPTEPDGTEPRRLDGRGPRPKFF